MYSSRHSFTFPMYLNAAVCTTLYYSLEVRLNEGKQVKLQMFCLNSGNDVSIFIIVRNWFAFLFQLKSQRRNRKKARKKLDIPANLVDFVCTYQPPISDTQAHESSFYDSVPKRTGFMLIFTAINVRFVYKENKIGVSRRLPISIIMFYVLPFFTPKQLFLFCFN